MKFVITLVAGAALLGLVQNFDVETMGTALQVANSMGIDDPWLIFQRIAGLAILVGGGVGFARTANLQNRLVNEDFGEKSPKGETSADQDNQVIIRWVASAVSAIVGTVVTLW